MKTKYTKKFIKQILRAITKDTIAEGSPMVVFCTKCGSLDFSIAMVKKEVGGTASFIRSRCADCGRVVTLDED